jgi:hypothetical protein
MAYLEICKLISVSFPWNKLPLLPQVLPYILNTGILEQLLQTFSGRDPELSSISPFFPHSSPATESSDVHAPFFQVANYTHNWVTETNEYQVQIIS